MVNTLLKIYLLFSICLTVANRVHFTNFVTVWLTVCFNYDWRRLISNGHITHETWNLLGFRACQTKQYCRCCTSGLLSNTKGIHLVEQNTLCRYSMVIFSGDIRWPTHWYSLAISRKWLLRLNLFDFVGWRTKKTHFKLTILKMWLTKIAAFPIRRNVIPGPYLTRNEFHLIARAFRLRTLDPSKYRRNRQEPLQSIGTLGICKLRSVAAFPASNWSLQTVVWSEFRSLLSLLPVDYRLDGIASKFVAQSSKICSSQR